MFDIDFIIPCYGRSEIIDKGIASIAIQWHKEFIHVTLVNDCSPNTDCNYQDLVDKYKGMIDIRVIKTPKNVGQGLARQYGIDNTTHDYFMFMDEDDQLGNGVAVSQFVGAVEAAGFCTTEDGMFVIDETGQPIKDPDKKPVCLISGPLFVFDDNTSYTIDNTNRVWVNSKIYSRKFIDKHNIRFNEAQSRHAEDYYWMSCFFYAMDNDREYQALLLDNNEKVYLWYPNQESQSRVDPHYGFMLSGYTMDGSVNILKYMKDSKLNRVEWTENTKTQYKEKIINMTMYSYFTFLSFIRHVAETDYIPKSEQDWYILRNACNELREMIKEDDLFQTYTYTEKIENYFVVKNNTDVNWTEPWIEFTPYIMDGTPELNWSYEELLECKKTYTFLEDGKKYDKVVI